mgnify:FL=1
MKILFESDCFSFSSFFYNLKTRKASHYINDVIDFGNLEINQQGLQDYMDFGYCVFGHTPVKDVYFLPHSSRLVQNEKGELSVERLKDDFLEALSGVTWSENEIWERIEDIVNTWERSTDAEIVIPTSGGYDSRILNWMIKDKSRIRSYTYGATTPQSQSFEVVYAQELSRRLGTAWKHIELGKFFNYIDRWYDLYGVSVHAHGLSSFEFFHDIRQDLPLSASDGQPLLSGHMGDDWAGSDFIDAIESPEDLAALSLNHGMCADSKQCCKREISEPKIIYWEENREKLRDLKFRIIETMRHKQMLFTYLERVPKQFGFEPFFPFKDMELAAAMLNLPQKRRRDRVWQQDFFRRNNIMMEDSCRVRRLPNDLSIRALDIVCPPPLDVKVLSEVVRPEYVEWINRYIRPTSLNRLQEVLLSVRGAGRVTKIFTGRIPKTVRVRASFAYRVLYPIERLLKSRI